MPATTANASPAQDPPIVAPAQRSLEELAQRLAGWLAARTPGASGVAICDVEYPRGAGMSHETILFTATWQADGTRHERGLVVRIKPSPTKSVYLDDMYIEQFRLMQAVHASGEVRIAEVLWLEEDPALLGAPFFVMERMRGRVPVSYPGYAQAGWLFDATPAQRRIAWEDSVRQLALIQRVPLDRLGFLSRGADGFADEIDRWRRTLEWICEPSDLPFQREAFAAIVRTAPADPPPGLVWGDARIGNMMFGDDFRVVAVMDWEQPSLGGALHDLGWWLYNEIVMTQARGVPRLEGMGTPAETIALWSEVSGIRVTDIEWYMAFAAFKCDCLRIHMLDGGWFQPAPGNDFSDSHGARYIAAHFGLTPPAPMPAR